MRLWAGLIILTKQMSKKRYSKPPLILTDQVQTLLINRGLLVADTNLAAHCLSNINYYRLSAYLRYFQVENDPTHTYKGGSTFDQAMNLYRFDRKLRLLVFDEIERIEIAVRTQIIYHYAINHGANWYEDEKLYKTSVFKDDFVQIFKKELGKTTEVFIKHYSSNYDTSFLPPSWMSLEIVSLGQVSRLYKNLRSNSIKKAVADNFGVQETVLESWLESLSYVRNICAHHSRLWNKKIPKTPALPVARNIKGQWIIILPHQSKYNRLFLSFAIMRYFLQFISPKTRFSQKLKDLLNEYPDVNNKSLGFPLNWGTDPFWA
jgi:abortive infection bacteriophage resistance protein